MTTIDELLAELDEEGHITRRVLERVPNERLAWRPHERSFTLGQLAFHVASLPAALADASTRPFDARTEIPRPAVESTEALLALHDRSVAEARRVLEAMGDAALDEPWRLVRGDVELLSLPRRAFLRSTLFNHWYHHRGQLTVYLRQVGST
ncbi:MAG TPA: DinB family protein, partial [Gemmatimonadaceae bacterium]|nr:DinB family protein [Gemmatimonadaceae bacterium]